MKRVLAILFLSVLATTIRAQDSPYELRLTRAINAMNDQQRLSYLPGLLRLSHSTPVRLVKGKEKRLPEKSPLLIYLAPETDRANAYFQAAIEEWNRSSAAKFRTVHIVNNPRQADVIFARFMDREWAREQYEMDTSHGPGALGRDFFSAPCFDYIVVPRSDELEVLALVYKLTPQEGTPASYRDISNRFFDLLKKQTK